MINQYLPHGLNAFIAKVSVGDGLQTTPNFTNILFHQSGMQQSVKWKLA